MDINFITYADAFKQINSDEIVMMADFMKNMQSHIPVSEETSNKVKKYVSMLVEENKKIDADKDKYFLAMMELNMPKHIIVIRERLINNKIWDDVADSMKLSRRSVQRIYSDAVKCFEPILACI